MEKYFGVVAAGLEPLISIRAAKRKLKIGEVPGPEPARISEKSKVMPFRWGSIFLIQVFRELYFWR